MESALHITHGNSTPPLAARLQKNAVGASAFVRFSVATFWAGVVASQRPIACPKRQLP